MCKHILNAQVSIRAPCCREWFDCPECHADFARDGHELKKTTEMAFACKKCKKAFRKDLSEFDEVDEYCPHCDNHFVLPALTPEAMLSLDPSLAASFNPIKASASAGKSVAAHAPGIFDPRMIRE